MEENLILAGLVSRVDDSRTPSSGGPLINIGITLIDSIKRLDPEVNQREMKDTGWEDKIFEVVTWYLEYIGVNPSLLQTGKITNDDETEKNYFFAGNDLLKEGDEILYKDLDDPSGLFQVVIIGKRS
ncbi:hypothetical protein GCM10027284_46370 [Cyclobacterium sediminis]